MSSLLWQLAGSSLILLVPATCDVLHEILATLTKTLEHAASITLEEIAFREVGGLVEGGEGVHTWLEGVGAHTKATLIPSRT